MTLECARHRRRAALAEIDVWWRDVFRSAPRHVQQAGVMRNIAAAWSISGMRPVSRAIDEQSLIRETKTARFRTAGRLFRNA
jgi:hypothetical protein